MLVVPAKSLLDSNFRSTFWRQVKLEVLNDVSVGPPYRPFEKNTVRARAAHADMKNEEKPAARARAEQS